MAPQLRVHPKTARPSAVGTPLVARMFYVMRRRFARALNFTESAASAKPSPDSKSNYSAAQETASYVAIVRAHQMPPRQPKRNESPESLNFQSPQEHVYQCTRSPPELVQ